jgi:preprotein translocase subunit SecD
MRSRQLLSIILTVALAVGALIYTFAVGNTPLLGLDLEGGVSVVLSPKAGQDYSQDELDESVDIMRRRVDALGVAEPEVAVQGDSIIVSLPGVDDPQRALELVGQTARLRFRPVLATDNVLFGGAPIEDPLTAPDDIEDDAEVVLQGEPDEDGNVTTYVLGPMGADGTAIADANAQVGNLGSWQVALDLNSGEDGLDDWNALATECFNRAETCPTALIAIELDGTVVSAPEVQTPTFDADGVSITGNFSEGEGKDLALVLRYGALPLELEPQQTQTISATLGRDALEAGIVSGIVGLLLVTLFMVAYYRLLGGVAILSLLVSFALLWSIIAWFGANQGLALTLAGITGLIVSIGVSVDSNVVYFENLKEDVRGGRPVRSASERSFSSAFSTIVKADVTTLIGAGLLYWLSIGPVRGFAFYLGLATLLDLVVSYFFMGPFVMLLGRRRRYQEDPRSLGIPRRRPTTSGSAPAAATSGGAR